MILRKILIVWCLALLGVSSQATAGATCKGKFPNPVTDYCWSCAFPFTIANQKVMIQGQETTDTISSAQPMCACSNPVRVGLKTGFWEPTRMVDVTRTPYCFPGLGGLTMNFGRTAPDHGNMKLPGQMDTVFYQAHWYTNPLMFWLEILLDDSCLEAGVFDLAYMTEIDPLWNDSTNTFIINPDVALFSNLIAQAACAVDCVAANFGFPLNALYWCAGCNGPMFPLNGWVGARVGGVQASSLLVARMTSKLHRELLMWGASGEDGTCGYYPQPLMDKQNYKYTMLYPIPQTKKILGRCCQPFGRSTALWGAGRSYPINGEDFVYQIFRKCDCCGGNLMNYVGG